MIARLALPLALILAPACTTARLLRVENQLLLQENIALRDELQARGSGPGEAAPLVRFAGYLDERGLPHTLSTDRSKLTTRCGRDGVEVQIQTFPNADVVYLGTAPLLTLDQVADRSAGVLLLTQIATLNYDTLLGKFQLDPETGAVSVSMELEGVRGVDGDGLTTALGRLCEVVAARQPDLLRAAAGTGL